MFWEAPAHGKIVNCVDGAGSEGCGYGPCEIVTGGRDGSVRLWDPRQKTPVISLDPAESADVLPDCWSVRYPIFYSVSVMLTIMTKEWWQQAMITEMLSFSISRIKCSFGTPTLRTVFVALNSTEKIS